MTKYKKFTNDILEVLKQHGYRTDNVKRLQLVFREGEPVEIDVEYFEIE